MKVPESTCGPPLPDPTNRRMHCCKFIPVAIFLCVPFFIGSPFIVNHNQGVPSTWGLTESTKKAVPSLCKNQCKPLGSEKLPKGIISRTSNLDLQPIWDPPQSPEVKDKTKELKSLLAIAVGIKQKKVVDLLVQKLFPCNFTIFLFHYDGAVDEWKDLSWSESALHVSAINQTKWWFAKRFLHPDIVDEYNYIFLWDEDLGVEHFHPGRYISIIEKEGLEISQPALDTAKSVVHHRITARGRKGDVHRRIYKYSGGGRCYENSTSPPCTGWVEMMAPVFSRAAWRCVWHMIQNDLIHAWGLDKKLGYCSQGDRTKHVGVVDREYIVHLGIPTLGGSVEHKMRKGISVHPCQTVLQKEFVAVLAQSSYARNCWIISEAPSYSSQQKTHNPVPPVLPILDNRFAMRQRSLTESKIFKRRWRRAVVADKCWTDPYPTPTEKKSN